MIRQFIMLILHTEEVLSEGIGVRQTLDDRIQEACIAEVDQTGATVASALVGVRVVHPAPESPLNPQYIRICVQTCDH